MNKELLLAEKLRTDCIKAGIDPTEVGKILSNIEAETERDYGGDWDFYKNSLKRVSSLFFLAGSH